MSITVNILADGTRGPKWDANNERTYTVVYECVTDANESGAVIATSGLLPTRFVSTHPNDNQAYCVDLDLEQDDGASWYWRAKATFKTAVPQFAQGKPDGGTQSSPSHPDNPLDWKPKISLSTKFFKVLALKDLDDVSFTNAAGVPYESTFREVPTLVIDVERNLAGFDYSLLNECNGAVNVDGFLGYDHSQVKCEHLSARVEHSKYGPYWSVKGQFIVGNDDQIIDPAAHPHGWWYEWKINAGYEYFDVAVNNYVPIYLPGGQKPSRPVPLTAAGTDYLRPSEIADINYIGFRVCRYGQFNSLGLFA